MSEPTEPDVPAQPPEGVEPDPGNSPPEAWTEDEPYQDEDLEAQVAIATDSPNPLSDPNEPLAEVDEVEAAASPRFTLPILPTVTDAKPPAAGGRMTGKQRPAATETTD